MNNFSNRSILAEIPDRPKKRELVWRKVNPEQHDSDSPWLCEVLGVGEYNIVPIGKGLFQIHFTNIADVTDIFDHGLPLNDAKREVIKHLKHIILSMKNVVMFWSWIFNEPTNVGPSIV